MIDLINKEKNEKILKDLDYVRTLINQNESDLTTQKINKEEYTLNMILLKEKIDELEKEIMK